MTNIQDLKPEFKDNPELFAELGKVNGFLEYLRNTVDANIRRHFDAQDDRSRNIIRGHKEFASYLTKKIIEHKKTKLDK